MMNKIELRLLVLFSSFLLMSCDKSVSIEGLWIVQQVKIREQIMTPDARWMRFNSDGTQTSGNGWFQHSVGTWKLNDKTQELSVNNTNGLKDPNGPFRITIDKDEMTWTRLEEGEKVIITLIRSDDLPQTFSDKILGLWKLEAATGNFNYFAPDIEKDSTASIFFRWDKRFVIQSSKGRINGVYNVHGHKPEVELIPYGDELNRNFWQIAFEENAITLKLLNTDSLVTRKFLRIHEFPK